MAEQMSEIRERLLKLDAVSPLMRESYRKELDAILEPRLTLWSKTVGIALLILLLGCAVLIARADVVYHVRGLMLVAHIILAAAFVWASALIIRSLRKQRHSQRSVVSIANILTNAAGTLTVIALLIGLRSPGDPRSLFGAFYVFVFYFACVAWAIESRITASELAAREQALRIEYRLADLAEHLQKH